MVELANIVGVWSCALFLNILFIAPLNARSPRLF